MGEMDRFLVIPKIDWQYAVFLKVDSHSTSKIFVLHSALNFLTVTRLKLGDCFFA